MTEKSKKHVDACRFCWMCRHICPVGNATGQERNTARARALGLSLVDRKALEWGDVADNLYECACCGACTKECATGWDPVMFVREARLECALEGALPEYIENLVDRCMETGNAYGVTQMEECLTEAVRRHDAQTDTLLFLGVDARCKAPRSAVDAILVLERAGAEFTVLEKEPPSGQQLEYLIGAAQETKGQMEACAAALNCFEKAVVFDPQDAKVFKREYKEWGIELTPKIETFTAFGAKLAEEGMLGGTEREEKMVYQDPFQLARDLEETEEPRTILAAFGGGREMLLNRRDTMWAGNLLMQEWMPEVIRKVAQNRIANAREAGADTIVAGSVSEYAALKEVGQTAIKIVSIEELILGETGEA